MATVAVAVEILLIVCIDCCQIIVIGAGCFTCYIDSMQFLLLYGGSLLDCKSSKSSKSSK